MIKIILTPYDKLLDKYIDGDLSWISLDRKKKTINKYIQKGYFVPVVDRKLALKGYVDVIRLYSFLRNHIEQNSIKEVPRKKFNTDRIKLEEEIKMEKKKIASLRNKTKRKRKPDLTVRTKRTRDALEKMQ